MAVLSQRVEINGPPKYFTPDWTNAGVSVRKLAALSPAVAATGHGQPMVGENLRRELDRLALEFEKLAVPDSGRYIVTPAVADENGVVTLPPPVPEAAPWIVTGAVVLTVAVLAMMLSQGS